MSVVMPMLSYTDVSYGLCQPRCCQTPCCYPWCARETIRKGCLGINISYVGYMVVRAGLALTVWRVCSPDMFSACKLVQQYYLSCGMCGPDERGVYVSASGCSAPGMYLPRCRSCDPGRSLNHPARTRVLEGILKGFKS